MKALTLANIAVSLPFTAPGKSPRQVSGAFVAQVLAALPETLVLPQPADIALYMKGLGALLWQGGIDDRTRKISDDGVYLVSRLLDEWSRWLDPLVTDPDAHARQYRVEITNGD